MLFKGKYYFLSNYYPCAIMYNGLSFTCVESAFHAQKNLSMSRFFVGMTAAESKKLGRQVELRPDWEYIKNSVMYELLRIKFSDPELMTQLKQVQGEIVEDNYWGDTYWGVFKGQGTNVLGKLLMKIRDDEIN